MIPRFTTLGALISGAMMTNVLMLNLCYDVPRKIFSVHLVLICLFLLIPDFRRLGNVLIFNRRADPVPETPLFDDKILNRIALFAQVAFGAYVLWVAGAQSIKDRQNLTATLPAPVRGVWSVKQFGVDGIWRPPLLTDSDRWRDVIFDAPKVLTIISMDGRQYRYYMEMDDSLKTFKLWDADDPHRSGMLTLSQPTADQMTLDGQVEGHPLNMKMDRIDLSNKDKYPLMNKGLNWVNPYIDNR